MEALPRIDALQEQVAHQGSSLRPFPRCDTVLTIVILQDLSYLGRDLSKVVMLDTNPDHVQLNQNNSILLTPWVGSRNDATSRELISLIPFLEALAINGVKDVREVIGHYQGEGKHIPTAYAEAEEKMRESKRIEWEAGREKREGKQKWIKALVGALGGGKVRFIPTISL